jgi:glycosyltransferase involved in cell wall biosynthesis
MWCFHEVMATDRRTHVSLRLGEAGLIPSTAQGVTDMDLPPSARGKNFGAGSGQRTLVRIYFDPDAHAAWRGRAYAVAFQIARELRARHVVDLGCRDGRALVDAFHGSGVETLGADLSYQVQAAAERFPERAWASLYPTDYAGLETLIRRTNAPGPLVILAIDVLEHLSDPRPLLRTVRRLLEADPRSRAVVAVTNRRGSTPDEGLGLPEHEEHYREWSADEVEAFLEAGGFWVDQRCSLGTDVEPEESTATVLTLRYDRDRHDTALAERGLPSIDIERLVLTTDRYPSHPSAKLGSYVEAASRVPTSEQVAFCLLGDLAADRPQSPPDRRWLFPSSLRGHWPKAHTLSDVALEVVEQLVYLYPKLAVVEYQDFRGIGHRVSQACRAGLLPPSVRTRVRCHGTTVYEELVSRSWIGVDGIIAACRERIAIELADSVSLSSEFLRRLYRDNGYRIDPSRSRVESYRFPFPERVPPVEYGDVAEVLVLGDAAWAPAKPPLVEALAEALTAASGADKAGALITHVPDPRTSVREILRAKAGRLVSVIAGHRPDAPLLLMEVVSIGCPVIVIDVGALRALVPDRLQREVVCAPDVESLARAICRVLDLTPTRRAEEVEALLRAMGHYGVADNRRLPSAAEDQVQSGLDDSPASRQPTATVVVPSYQTPPEYLRDVIEGLNQQSLKPDEVLFIDDASGSPYVDQLEQAVASQLRLPYRVIRREANGGVAAARHSALAEARTDIMIVIDADDIPQNDFVRLYSNYFARNPGVCAVDNYRGLFDDGNDWRASAQVSDPWGPVGGSVLVGHVGHCFGASHAAFDVAALRESGGWQLPDSKTAEDREMALKLLAMNKRLAIVPRCTMLYRQRGGSLWTGRDQLDLMRPVARSMPVYDLFDRLRLFALVQAHRDLAQRANHLTRDLQQARKENQRSTKELERLRSSTKKLERLGSQIDELQSRHARLRTQLDRPDHRMAQRIGRLLRRLR